MSGERRGKICLFSPFLFPALAVLGPSVKRYVEIPAKFGQDFNHGFSVAGENPAHWPSGADSTCCKEPVLTPRHLTTTPLHEFSRGSAGPCCLDALHALGRKDGARDSKTCDHAWG